MRRLAVGRKTFNVRIAGIAAESGAPTGKTFLSGY
jgi:hypothetical protein